MTLGELSTWSLLWLISCSILWNSLRIQVTHVSGSSAQRKIKKGGIICPLASISLWPRTVPLVYPTIPITLVLLVSEKLLNKIKGLIS